MGDGSASWHGSLDGWDKLLGVLNDEGDGVVLVELGLEFLEELLNGGGSGDALKGMGNFFSSSHSQEEASHEISGASLLEGLRLGLDGECGSAQQGNDHEGSHYVIKIKINLDCEN